VDAVLDNALDVQGALAGLLDDNVQAGWVGAVLLSFSGALTIFGDRVFGSNLEFVEISLVDVLLFVGECGIFVLLFAVEVVDVCDGEGDLDPKFSLVFVAQKIGRKFLTSHRRIVL
jgi:hypothetical protein